jgi:hypothetical protein
MNKCYFCVWRGIDHVSWVVKMLKGLRKSFTKSFLRNTELSVTPKRYYLHISKFLDYLLLKIGNRNPVNFSRFINVNRLPVEPIDGSIPSIELLYVAAKKDFEILSNSVRVSGGLVLPNGNLGISVIVPESELLECKLMFKDFAIAPNIISENDIVSRQQAFELKNHFKERYGWILQQIIKLKFTLDSSCDGVLIIDADTILLRPRLWLDGSGRQLLTPTWEYHLPYYKFLSSAGVCDINPEYTFVSHHMLMQPKILNEIFSFTGWTDIEGLIDSICSTPNEGEHSPFSLDYELYAQYLYAFHRDKVLLGKWSNKALSRSSKEMDFEKFIEEVVLENSDRFASLSFHSYL